MKILNGKYFKKSIHNKVQNSHLKNRNYIIFTIFSTYLYSLFQNSKNYLTTNIISVKI